MSSQRTPGDWYDGKGSTWDAIKAGATEGAKDFFKDPVGETAKAAKDFNNAGDLTSSVSNSGSAGNGSGNSSNSRK